jgi:hypothetical protein
VATALPNVDPSEIGLTISPNPAPLGQFELKLETRTRANLDISLLNTMGQKVYHEKQRRIYRAAFENGKSRKDRAGSILPAGDTR